LIDAGPIHWTRSPGTADALVLPVMSKSGRTNELVLTEPVMLMNMSDIVPLGAIVTLPGRLPPDANVTLVMLSISAGLGRSNAIIDVGIAIAGLTAGTARCTCSVRVPPGVVPASGVWLVVKVGSMPAIEHPVTG